MTYPNFQIDRIRFVRIKMLLWRLGIWSPCLRDLFELSVPTAYYLTAHYSAKMFDENPLSFVCHMGSSQSGWHTFANFGLSPNHPDPTSFKSNSKLWALSFLGLEALVAPCAKSVKWVTRWVFRHQHCDYWCTILMCRRAPGILLLAQDKVSTRSNIDGWWSPTKATWRR